jgi:UDP-hydrolysing UDP-N-acetyl-D-glucosamine 2-epimerase
MINKRKINVVITARPSYSRIRTFLEANRDNPGNIDIGIICAASALTDMYGNIYELIKNDGHKIDCTLHCLVSGNEPISMAQTLSGYTSQLSSYFFHHRPDAVITIADRYETLGTAIASSYLNIPLIHIQGGEITGSIDDKIRYAVTALSDYHFVSNQEAASRILSLNMDPQKVFIVGCPSIDLCGEIQKIDLSDVTQAVNFSGVGDQIDLTKPYIVMLYHPDTNKYKEAASSTQFILDKLAQINIQLIIMWPNTDAGGSEVSHAIRMFREKKSSMNLIRYIKNLKGDFFLKLLSNASLLMGNSSVGIRECSAMGVKVINIGNRQSGRDRAENVIDVNDYEENLLQIIDSTLKSPKPRISSLYGNGNAGYEMNKILQNISF